ncbi:TetR/AcrR family transcriptional regulator [Mycobacterium spongiae]|uniref:TetR family transcriptional regulator n=1 Tax=Mycobacterium spongiae TaxID=886343 RepID=A0A975JX14_9MYCO|nr:TetR/AcrR family transcriptional regulator [Mycobacterium spongiae]QUR66233.1 TetR family transcriptional regulator [Mycobacterium spongiae]
MPRRIDVDGLFDATVRVFAERGYRATTTQEIASRGGVNEVTLFRRYGDKATLINTALTHALAKSPFARVTVTDDVRADLVALVQAYAATVETYGGAVMTLLVEIPRHPELRGAMAAFTPNLLNAVQVIATHQDRGQLRPGDPVQKLVTLIAPLMVVGLWARTGAEIIAPKFDPDALVTAFLDGQRGN